MEGLAVDKINLACEQKVSSSCSFFSTSHSDFLLFVLFFFCSFCFVTLSQSSPVAC